MSIWVKQIWGGPICTFSWARSFLGDSPLNCIKSWKIKVREQDIMLIQNLQWKYLVKKFIFIYQENKKNKNDWTLAQLEQKCSSSASVIFLIIYTIIKKNPVKNIVALLNEVKPAHNIVQKPKTTCSQLFIVSKFWINLCFLNVNIV